MLRYQGFYIKGPVVMVVVDLEQLFRLRVREGLDVLVFETHSGSLDTNVFRGPLRLREISNSS